MNDAVKELGSAYKAEVEMLNQFKTDINDKMPVELALYKVTKGNITLYLLTTQESIVEVKDPALAKVLFDLYKEAANSVNGLYFGALGAQEAVKKGDSDALFRMADKYFLRPEKVPEVEKYVKQPLPEPVKTVVPEVDVGKEVKPEVKTTQAPGAPEIKPKPISEIVPPDSMRGNIPIYKDYEKASAKYRDYLDEFHQKAGSK